MQDMFSFNAKINNFWRYYFCKNKFFQYFTDWRKMVCGPALTVACSVRNTLSFNRTQSRAVTGLLTGHNTLRRHLHLLGLLDSPLCRRCGAEEETSAHTLCECEALASLRHMYLGPFFLEPEDIKSISLGAIWNVSKVTGLP